MKFKCEKAELQNACSTASRATAAKSPITALEGLKLKLTGSRLEVTGYDLRKGIKTEIETEADEGGEIVVNSKLFCEMLRRLPDGKISIASDSNLNIHVKCGRSQFNINGIDSSDFPELPNVEQINHIIVPQNILKNMIGQTIFAVADNDNRPIYTGTLFEIEGSSLTLVSVDGFRLAKRTEMIMNGSVENCSFVVPGYSLADVERICQDDEEKTVSISIGQKHISFDFGNAAVITRRLEGDFLNYKKSIPESFRYTVTVDRADMISTIDRVSLIISEKNTNPIRMTFGDGKITCLSITPIGKAEDICSCSGNGEDMEIGFNDRYFMDALKAANVSELKLCLNTSSSPCVIEAADNSRKFTYMVLPVRLRAGD